MTTIEQIVKKLLIKEPFYGIFLLGLRREFGNKCQTACVFRDGINVALCINEEFWNNLESDEMREAIIKHEVGHILFKHITMSENFDNHTRFNYAADCEVNSNIPLLQQKPWVYPAGFNLANNLGTKTYYEQIDISDHSPDSTFHNNNSDCPNPDKSGNQSDDQQSQIDPSDSHASWKDFQNISEAEKELIEQQTDFLAKHTAEQVQKMCGNIPGQFKEYIDNLFKQKEPVFNWKAYFRRILGNSILMYLKNTRYKPSVRFPDSPGTILKSKPKVLVAVDTSGSVSDKELSDFFTEIQHLYKSGVQIDVVEFDTRIHTRFRYKGPKEIPINGRGGTDATEVFKLYNTDKSYSTLVVFTDGYLSINHLKAQNVVWVITSNGSKQDYPGKAVYIPKENK